MMEDKHVKYADITNISTAGPGEVNAADKTGKSPLAEALQAMLMEEALLEDEQDLPVCRDFLWRVLYEQDFCISATKMLEIAKQLEADPALSGQVDHNWLAGELEGYLLQSFFKLAMMEDYLPDDLVFKLNLYKGYMETDDINKACFFSSANNVRRAEVFEFLPQEG